MPYAYIVALDPLVRSRVQGLYTYLRMNRMNNIHESRNITSLVMAFYSLVIIKALQYVVSWFHSQLHLLAINHVQAITCKQCA